MYLAKTHIFNQWVQVVLAAPFWRLLLPLNFTHRKIVHFLVFFPPLCAKYVNVYRHSKFIGSTLLITGGNTFHSLIDLFERIPFVRILIKLKIKICQNMLVRLLVIFYLFFLKEGQQNFALSIFKDRNQPRSAGLLPRCFKEWHKVTWLSHDETSDSRNVSETPWYWDVFRV